MLPPESICLTHMHLPIVRNIRHRREPDLAMAPVYGQQCSPNMSPPSTDWHPAGRPMQKSAREEGSFAAEQTESRQGCAKHAASGGPPPVHRSYADFSGWQLAGEITTYCPFARQEIDVAPPTQAR
jgi:hypothetical protein